MKNLTKITNYYNNIQAREDWRKVAAFAAQAGLSAEAIALAPVDIDTATWRRIDRRIDKLRERAAAKGVVIPLACELNAGQ